MKEDEMDGACSMGEMKNVYSILVGKFEGGRRLGRPKCRWEDNIRMDVRKTEGCVSWIHPARCMDQWWAIVSTVMSLWVRTS
jgi:hypothetical protein